MKNCGKCGFANEASMRFCLECGNVLDTGPQMVIPLTEVAQESSEKQTDSFEDQTVVANRLTPSVPTVNKKGNGRRALKIFALVVLGGIALVTVAAAGVGLAVYFAIVNTSEKPIVKKQPKRPIVISTPTPKPSPTASPTPEPTETPTPSPSPEPSATPKGDDPDPTQKAKIKVATDDGWQVSKIWTVEKENFKVTASGRYELDGIKRRVSPKGVSGHKERRVFKQFRTGALLMRTHYPDGTHSNIQAVSNGKYWQNYPDEKGYLEFMINDSELDNNDGTLEIKFEKTDGLSN